MHDSHGNVGTLATNFVIVCEPPGIAAGRRG